MTKSRRAHVSFKAVNMDVTKVEKEDGEQENDIETASFSGELEEGEIAPT